MSTEVSRQIRKYDQNNILSGCKYAEKNADNLYTKTSINSGLRL